MTKEKIKRLFCKGLKVEKDMFEGEWIEDFYDFTFDKEKFEVISVGADGFTLEYKRLNKL